MASKEEARKKLEAEIELVRVAARGREIEILEEVAGIGRHFLNNVEGPCPKCGGDTRFRLMDETRGAVRCSHCFHKSCGDYFAAVGWMQGLDFMGSAKLVGKHLNVKVGGTEAEPDAAQFVPGRWNDMLVALWCLEKPGTTPQACKRLGATLGMLKGIAVIAFPVVDERLDHLSPVGYIFYALSGGTLPKFDKQDDGTWKVEQVKVKVSYKCGTGIVCNPGELKAADRVVKCEGTPDVLACLSWDLPAGTTAFTNSNGCGQYPPKWVTEAVAGKDVLLVGDCDKPGQEGISGKWGPMLAENAKSCTNFILPYPIEKTHGKDLRDYKNDGADFAALLSCKAVAYTASSPVKVEEDTKDPWRLARENLDAYQSAQDGGKLRYWRSEFYRWKLEDGCWVRISDDDLRAKVTKFVKRKMDDAFMAGKSQNSKKKFADSVNSTLIANVVLCTKSLTHLGSSRELMHWIDRGICEKRTLIAVKNGLLDVDMILYGNDPEKALLPHAPEWWSTICLPYEYDYQAVCDRWQDFAYEVQPDDDAVKVLQEWNGYAITPNTDLQKFMCLEGSGSNGKSVYLAGLRGIVGAANCSDLSLEDFTDQFAAGDTLGKLLNISSDVGEVDKCSEGVVKKFADGSRMSFNRKGLARISASPTARLVMSWNIRPRFTDRSSGIWRRMLIIPFNVEIPDSRKILGMDKWEYWHKIGELPGMLNWSLHGRARLEAQKGFTKAKCIREALESYQDETNPVREFLGECVIQGDTVNPMPAEVLYGAYDHWCRKSGRHKLASSTFNREVEKRFKIAREMKGSIPNRVYVWPGLRFCMQKIYDLDVEAF